MNTITVLLGSTGLLLLVAVILSFKVMNDRTDEDEIRKLKREIAALEAADEFTAQPNVLDTQPLLSSVPAPTPVAPAPQLETEFDPPAFATQPPVQPEPSFPDTPGDESGDPVVSQAAEEITDLDAAIDEADREFVASQRETENDLHRREEEVLRTAAGVAWQSQNAQAAKNSARAKTIQEAYLIARITHYDEEHMFAVADILDADNAAPGTVLAIRRRTGIYGQVTVDHVPNSAQAIVNPIANTFLGEEGIDIQPGDELIVPPP